jgi:hypothetical protein
VITLTDRYLYAIEEALPGDVVKSDVVAEIRDDLESQFEAREIELGRPLTVDDETNILRAYGHPRIVAARYGRVQYLIGPDLLPFYWSTMRNVLTAGVSIVLMGGSVAAIVTRNGSLFFDALGVAWNTALWIVAVVTILFAASERVPREGEPARNRLMPAWNPQTLPAPGGLPPVAPYAALVEFVVNCIAVLVLLDARGAHHIPLDALVAEVLAGIHVALTTAWYPAYYATIAGSALVAGAAITVFVRPHLAVLQELFRIVASMITLIGLAITLANGPWLIAPSPLWNVAIQVSLIATILAMLLNVGLSVRSLTKQRDLVLHALERGHN